MKKKSILLKQVCALGRLFGLPAFSMQNFLGPFDPCNSWENKLRSEREFWQNSQKSHRKTIHGDPRRASDKLEQP